MNRLSKLSHLSLSWRITLVMAAVIAAAGSIIGYSTYAEVSRSLNNELNLRLSNRLAWLHASIEVENGLLVFEFHQNNIESPDQWKVSLPEGEVLCSANWNDVRKSMSSLDRT